MAKFAKGDKVVSVKSGAKGVVDEVYGEEKYAVLFDGAANPDRVEGFQIKAANGCAKNAKFKVGDRVRDTEAMRDGVIVEVDAEKPGYYAVKYDTRPQPQWNVPESYLTLANSAPIRSANSVVQNAINARTARNSDGDIGMVEREYIAAIRAVQALAIKAKSIDPRSRMYQDAVKAGTALYGGMKPSW